MCSNLFIISQLIQAIVVGREQLSPLQLTSQFFKIKLGFQIQITRE